MIHVYYCSNPNGGGGVWAIAKVSTLETGLLLRHVNVHYSMQVKNLRISHLKKTVFLPIQARFPGRSYCSLLLGHS